MKLLNVALAITPFIGFATADLHKFAVCIYGLTSTPIGGSPFSVSYNWAKKFSINSEATKCACDLYRQRNTGTNQWDVCPDCTYNAEYAQCESAGYHIGGDEMKHYCVDRCQAEGAESSP
ncbi:hypothetical protein J1614_000123 [Plenodomus biglobosus]|nr:hypothetical protein J1614_000123 [Plenodomus biglobosus]